MRKLAIVAMAFGFVVPPIVLPHFYVWRTALDQPSESVSAPAPLLDGA